MRAADRPRAVVDIGSAADLTTATSSKRATIAGNSKAVTMIKQPALAPSPKHRPAPMSRALAPKLVARGGQFWKPIDSIREEAASALRTARARACLADHERLQRKAARPGSGAAWTAIRRSWRPVASAEIRRRQTDADRRA